MSSLFHGTGLMLCALADCAVVFLVCACVRACVRVFPCCPDDTPHSTWTSMPNLRVTVVVDSDMLSSTSSSPADSSSGHGGPTAIVSTVRVGVGMGKVSSTVSGEVPDPDAHMSFFGPGGSRHHRVFSGTKLYACPLYLTAARRVDEHIMDVWLPTQTPPQVWVLRGVALLCSDTEL